MNNLHTLAQLLLILYIGGFLIHAGSWEGDCGDEGCGGRVRNQRTRDVCYMAPINIQMAAMEFFVLYFVFYLLLKCDLIEETLVAHKKCIY